MNIFLTDGIRFIGPYDRDTESSAIARGVRTLRETLGATDVDQVKADTLDEAKRLYAKSKK